MRPWVLFPPIHSPATQKSKTKQTKPITGCGDGLLQSQHLEGWSRRTSLGYILGCLQTTKVSAYNKLAGCGDHIICNPSSWELEAGGHQGLPMSGRPGSSVTKNEMESNWINLMSTSTHMCIFRTYRQQDTHKIHPPSTHSPNKHFLNPIELNYY